MQRVWKITLRCATAQKWLAFGLGFALFFGYLLVRNEQENPYDAWTYTQLSQSFIQNGLMNFSAFARDCGEGMRGYLFPWILAACNGLSLLAPWLDYRFMVSVFTSLSFAVVLPDLMSLIFGTRPFNFAQRMLAPVLMLVFWHGLLAYRLTDLWSAGLAVIAVHALLRLFTGTPLSWARRCGLAALCGFAVGAAYNIRTIYLFLIFGVGALYLLLCLVKHEVTVSRKLAGLLCILVGFGLVSLPQMLINHQAFGNLSFTLVSDSGANLYINKLYDGIYITKYESYTGVDYWYDRMNYVDPVGQALLEEEGMDATFEFGTGATALGNLGAYAALVLRHPMDFIGIYARHVFSLLDVRYPNMYISDFDTAVWLPLVNYTVLYLSLAALWRALRTMPPNRRMLLWALAALLLPTLAILLGTIETRYGILLYLTLWVVLAAALRGETFKGIKARNIALLVGGYLVFLGVMCACNGAISASLLEYPLLY